MTELKSWCHVTVLSSIFIVTTDGILVRVFDFSETC